MKYIITILIPFLSIIMAKDNTTYLKVDGMKCSYSCSGKVSNIVQNIKGVKDCKVDFEKGIATVVYDDKKLQAEDIVQGLKDKTIYSVTEVENKIKEKESSKI